MDSTSHQCVHPSLDDELEAVHETLQKMLLPGDLAVED